MSHRSSPLLGVAQTRYRPPRAAFSSCDRCLGTLSAHHWRYLAHFLIRPRVRLLMGVVPRHEESLIVFEHRLLACAVPRLALRPWRPPHLFGRVRCCRHCRHSMTFSLADDCSHIHVSDKGYIGKNMQDIVQWHIETCDAPSLAISEACDRHSYLSVSQSPSIRPREAGTWG